MAEQINRVRMSELREEADRLSQITGVDADELLDLARAGFSVADTEEVFRMIVSSSAREKEGKTHWSIATAPEPVALINLDLGIEGVTNKFPGKKIIQLPVTTRQQKVLDGDKYTMDDAELDWDKLNEAMRTVVKSKIIRTVVIDTMTDAWEVCRVAKHGKLKEVMPQQYSEANAEFRAFATMPYMRKDLNAVYIHKVKKEYKGKNWSGEYERQGFNEMGFIAQVNIEHFRVDADEDENQPFGIRVVDCRQNADIIGEELVGPMCSFISLARVVHPNSKKDDWR